MPSRAAGSDVCRRVLIRSAAVSTRTFSVMAPAKHSVKFPFGIKEPHHPQGRPPRNRGPAGRGARSGTRSRSEPPPRMHCASQIGFALSVSVGKPLPFRRRISFQLWLIEQSTSDAACARAVARRISRGTRKRSTAAASSSVLVRRRGVLGLGLAALAASSRPIARRRAAQVTSVPSRGGPTPHLFAHVSRGRLGPGDLEGWRSPTTAAGLACRC